MKVAVLATDGVEQVKLDRPWQALEEAGALVLPGGVINGDFVRADADAVAFVKALFDAGKPVAAICHAPWVLAEADVLRGR